MYVLCGSAVERHAEVVDCETVVSVDHASGRVAAHSFRFESFARLGVIDERLYVVEQHQSGDGPELVWIVAHQQSSAEFVFGKVHLSSNCLDQQLERLAAVSPLGEPLAAGCVDDLAVDPASLFGKSVASGVVAPLAPCHRQADVQVEAVVVVLLEVHVIGGEAEVVAPADGSERSIVFGDVCDALVSGVTTLPAVRAVDVDGKHVLWLSSNGARHLVERELLPEFLQANLRLCAHDFSLISGCKTYVSSIIIPNLS